MRTKNIFKTLAAAMLMPAMLLTTACSSEDDAPNNTVENTAKKGYTLPVTINVTRQGDDATSRATYNEDTKQLEFSTNDKLFVKGSHDEAGRFAGTLARESGGTFSGTITTEHQYSGTAQALLESASQAKAYLLPAGYEFYDYITITNNSDYDDDISNDNSEAFATSKAGAVEQFSMESADSYSNGFALAPTNAILNFTITGLTAGASVTVNFNGVVSEGVLADNSGTTTFAIGYAGGTDLKDCTLTVGDNNITLVNESKTLEAGHIYNITRSVATNTVNLPTLYLNHTAQNGETLTGTLTHNNVKISIADGATVTLDGVTINVTPDTGNDWAGINCVGNATIILKGTNEINGFLYKEYPCIYVPTDKTLTIQGDGSLYAISNGNGAGIGGGYDISCGNIVIEGGTITAKGGSSAAGIGSGYASSCGNITIKGGTIEATGGWMGAGIGCGNSGNGANKPSCGNITITDGVTRVTAWYGTSAYSSIGIGGGGLTDYNHLGTITIGGTVYFNGTYYENGGDSYLKRYPGTYEPNN